MIDLSRECLIPLADLPKLRQLPLKRTGKRISISTLYRWTHHGVRGRRLESVLVGGHRYTSLEALQRFLDNSQATKHVEDFTKKRAERTQEKIEEELDRLGI